MPKAKSLFSFEMKHHTRGQGAGDRECKELLTASTDWSGVTAERPSKLSGPFKISTLRTIIGSESPAFLLIPKIFTLFLSHPYHTSQQKYHLHLAFRFNYISHYNDSI